MLVSLKFMCVHPRAQGVGKTCILVHQGKISKEVKANMKRLSKGTLGDALILIEHFSIIIECGRRRMWKQKFEIVTEPIERLTLFV